MRCRAVRQARAAAILQSTHGTSEFSTKVATSRVLLPIIDGENAILPRTLGESRALRDYRARSSVRGLKFRSPQRGAPRARIPIQASGIVRRSQWQEMMNSQLELSPGKRGSFVKPVKSVLRGLFRTKVGGDGSRQAHGMDLREDSAGRKPGVGNCCDAQASDCPRRKSATTAKLLTD